MTIKIQDLLVEDFTRIFIPLLRLGAMESSPKNWELALRNQQFLESADLSDENILQKLQSKLEIFIPILKEEFARSSPNKLSAEKITKFLLDYISPVTLRQSFPAYRREIDFERVKTGFTTLLKECAEHNTSWIKTLDEFEGIGQVSLMTVHKSKGLEFHTMIFYGLDNKSWWSLTPNKPEELNTFLLLLPGQNNEHSFHDAMNAAKLLVGLSSYWAKQV